MISRCKWCNSVCPDFSEVCDGCANIEFECDELRQDIEEEDQIKLKINLDGNLWPPGCVCPDSRLEIIKNEDIEEDIEDEGI